VAQVPGARIYLPFDCLLITEQQININNGVWRKIEDLYLAGAKSICTYKTKRKQTQKTKILMIKLGNKKKRQKKRATAFFGLALFFSFSNSFNLLSLLAFKTRLEVGKLIELN